MKKGGGLMKWTWIGMELAELGFNHLRQKAFIIDDALYELYPDEEKPFPRRLRMLFSFCVRKLAQYDIYDALCVIRRVACTPEFCVACRHADRTAGRTDKKACDICLFGKAHGRCDDDGSLFDDFLKALDEVIGWTLEKAEK